MNENTWKLVGRSIRGDLPVVITIRNEFVLSFEPASFLEPKPDRLLGFAKPRPEEGDRDGETEIITEGRRLEVTYEQATEEGTEVVGTGLLPYFHGAGSYDVLLAMTVESFDEVGN